MSIQQTQIYNLPLQPTPFIGREPEIAEIAGLLNEENCRLLTLLGAGGMGKTRLSIESIRRLTSREFEHGVFYVPLAPLTSAENIVTTVIGVLGILIGDDGTPQEELIKFLGQRNLLLVMDNFEHVLDGADLVADILNNAPHVKILATSRETLNLSMEHIWHVHGMHYPDSEEPDDINQYDALNLFIERALQVRRDFSPSDQQIAIIQICQRVEGLPLVIELAASWLKTLSCRDILQQIERGIDFLATRNRDIPERHRSIRAVFEHSWSLLSSGEQAVFPRLSIFRGGFTLDAAQKVANADLMTLSGLVEKSMVRRDASGRYDLHELIRQYGEEHLNNTSAVTIAHKQHLNYFANFMEQRIPDLQGRRQVDSLNEIRADFDNIRIAFQYASEHSNYVKLDKMLECIAIYFDIISYPPSVNEVYGYAIAHLDESSEREHDRIRNRLNMFSLYTKIQQGKAHNIEHMIDDIQACLKVAEQYDDQLVIWMCLMNSELSGNHLQHQPDIQHVLEVGEHLGAYYLGRTLGYVCHYYTIFKNENNEMMLQYLNHRLEVTQTIGDVNGLAGAYSHVAQHARFWGKIEDAVYYFNKASQEFQQTHNIPGVAVSEAMSIFMMLRLGEFAYVVQKTAFWNEQLTRFGFFGNHSYMYMVMSRAEALIGNYDRSKAYLQHSRSAPIDTRPRIAFHIVEVEIMCAIGLDNFQSVRTHIIQALHIHNSFISTRLMLDFFILVVFLYHHDHHYTKAVELLGLIFTHPLTVTGWMEKWELLSQLRETLQRELGEEAYTLAWERGAQLDVDQTIAEIRAYVGIDVPVLDTPLQPLAEPLTERELEVLVFLGKGFSNRDIAAQLTVVVGTVKSHVHNICQKLGVKNRTQAVLQAKKLGLL